MMMKAIGAQQSDTAKILEGAIKIQTEEAREEEEQMRKRKVNVIVHGLGEPKGATANDRENEDKEVTEELLHALSCNTVSVRQVTSGCTTIYRSGCKTQTITNNLRVRTVQRLRVEKCKKT